MQTLTSILAECRIAGLDSKNFSDRKTYILLGLVGKAFYFISFVPMNTSKEQLFLPKCGSQVNNWNVLS
jgi:hypothetical protein